MVVAAMWRLANYQRQQKDLFMDVTIQSLTLTVGDLERSIEFYTGIFGFPPAGPAGERA